MRTAPLTNKGNSSIMNDSQYPLRGKYILITRPANQAQDLCELINEKGGTPLLFPTIHIAAPKNKKPLTAAIQKIEQYDIAIFTSANAVRNALFCSSKKFDHLHVFAIGSATANALKQHNINHVLHPFEKFDSEHLLAMKELQNIERKQIVIFTGEGGRNKLAYTLKKRGGHVDSIAVYRRIKPHLDFHRYSNLWEQHKINIIVAASNESLQNLFELIPPQEHHKLLTLFLLVVSQRAIPLAAKLGFKHKPIIASRANDEGIINALIQWAMRKND